MRERRTFLGVITGGLLATPLATEAQQTGKMWRTGLFGTASTAFPREDLKTLRYGERKSLRMGLPDFGR